MNDLIKEGLVLNAIFEGGKKPTGIRYFQMPLSGETTERPRSAEITVVNAGMTSVKLLNGGLDYYTNEDFVFQNGEEYEINVLDQETGLKSSAQVTIPPAISLIVQELDTVIINDPENETNHAGLVQWTSPDPDKYSFIVKLENLEENPVAINQLPTGQFRNRFSGPQLEPFLNLLKSDFQYLGNHKLTVYAIDRQFEQVFFFDAADLRGILQNGPENVAGCHGFVAGVSSFEIEIFVQE